ncbi:hypothetical protein [Herbaspirillum sp.]|uniref:hypothetical protein n=1 Tax=Herbaspirillum sp. TaxID=1890675 RepID=UPI001B26750E|nr:hypothetical protein [Herbaspirillum sp.]MBO9538413.1 hypothetical protein [Herbaspirillum sp.]
MSTVSIFVKDAGFSNNLRALAELAKFVVQRIAAAHALKPVRNDASELYDADSFAGVEDHVELENRLRQLENGHMQAVWKLQSQI